MQKKRPALAASIPARFHAATMLTPLMGNMLCNASPRDPLASG
jgi:hypothetical protein